jgi:hypothetical protein
MIALGRGFPGWFGCHQKVRGNFYMATGATPVLRAFAPGSSSFQLHRSGGGEAGVRFSRTNSRFEPLNRDTIPGSAGVSPASSGFRLPTGRRDTGAPRRFMGRADVPLIFQCNLLIFNNKPSFHRRSHPVELQPVFHGAKPSTLNRLNHCQIRSKKS